MTQESFIRLDGKTTATEIKKEIAQEVQQMVAAGQRPPCLGAIIVGHDGASETYIASKIKACEDEMEACGAREVELDNEINSPEVYNDPDLLRQKSDELSDLRFHQEELFAAWEKAMEEQEQYEQAAGEE